MIRIFLSSLFLVFLSACQSKPTKVIEESVNVFANHTVLVDTRSSFEYASYHIAGSVNLNTADYLVLKNPKTNLRILDPDINQTIERLAKRGISPNKSVILLSETPQSTESKKWKWMLKNIEVDNVELMTINEFKKENKNRPLFSEPEPEKPWILNSSEDLQKEFIFKKSKDCFVKWSDKVCG